MIFDRVSEITHEKLDEKTIFELTKKPVDKEKSRAFGFAHPIWLRGWDSGRDEPSPPRVYPRANPRPID